MAGSSWVPAAGSAMMEPTGVRPWPARHTRQVSPRFDALVLLYLSQPYHPVYCRPRLLSGAAAGRTRRGRACTCGDLLSTYHLTALRRRVPGLGRPRLRLRGRKGALAPLLHPSTVVDAAARGHPPVQTRPAFPRAGTPLSPTRPLQSRPLHQLPPTLPPQSLACRSRLVRPRVARSLRCRVWLCAGGNGRVGRSCRCGRVLGPGKRSVLVRARG
jgi:hypothetical protein